MMKNYRTFKDIKQKGFTMIEVLMTVTMIGILASIAVPRFTGSLEIANTAKVQADLQTLDAAVVMYEAENGKLPADIEDLKPYVNDMPKPPDGKCRLKDSEETVDTTGKEYELTDVTTGGVSQRRAVCDGHTAGDFGK